MASIQEFYESDNYKHGTYAKFMCEKETESERERTKMLNKCIEETKAFDEVETKKQINEKIKLEQKCLPIFRYPKPLCGTESECEAYLLLGDYLEYKFNYLISTGKFDIKTYTNDFYNFDLVWLSSLKSI